MTTQAFVGDVVVAVGNGASPEVFTRYCEVIDLGGLGQANELVEATTFCSGGNKEYVGGLADGKEVTIQANYDPDNATQAALIAAVVAKTVKNFHVIVEHDSPTSVFAFSGTMLSWEFVPSKSDVNKISFTFKITGGITITAH